MLILDLSQNTDGQGLDMNQSYLIKGMTRNPSRQIQKIRPLESQSPVVAAVAYVAQPDDHGVSHTTSIENRLTNPNQRTRFQLHQTHRRKNQLHSQGQVNSEIPGT